MPTVIGQITGLSFVLIGGDWTSKDFIMCSCFLSFTPDSLVVIAQADLVFRNSVIVLVVGLSAVLVGGCVDIAG